MIRGLEVIGSISPQVGCCGGVALALVCIETRSGDSLNEKGLLSGLEFRKIARGASHDRRLKGPVMTETCTNITLYAIRSYESKASDYDLSGVFNRIKFTAFTPRFFVPTIRSLPLLKSNIN